MKKLLLPFLIISFIFTVNVNAQMFAEKGVMHLGGMVGFTSTTSVTNGETAENSTSIFDFSPFVGYFIIDGFELGLMPNFYTFSHGDNSQTNFSVWFAPAYYFMLQRSNIYPYIQGLIGYNSNTYENTTGNVTVESTLTGISYGGAAGLKVQVGNSALINFGVRYVLITLNPEDWDGDRNGSNNLVVSAGFSIFFGR